MSKNLYLIAGPNGAGKTTASMKILPRLLDCEEFVNADEIAHGLSPFHPEEVAIEAGRLQIERIDTLIKQEKTFSIETTLAVRSYAHLIRCAHKINYKVVLLFFWLPSVDVAIERVRQRVAEGGHNVSEHTIRRRYDSGIRNLFHLYMPIVDVWMLIANHQNPAYYIAEKFEGNKFIVHDESTFKKITRYAER